MKPTLALIICFLVLPSQTVGQDNIDVALASCQTSGSAGGIAPGTDLFRVTVDTSIYPKASCNDGSPAVFYVRKAADQDNQNNWHVHLQGGGSCKNDQECAERWCSYDTNYGFDKMSTTSAPSGMRGRGIFNTNAGNEFADWNHVYSYYCSSDSWNGDSTNVVLSTVKPNGTPLDFSINFNGSNIVDAIISTLKSGTVSPDTVLVDEFVMPDIDDADIVLFSGTSGGGNGVVFNVDKVGDILLADNPDLDYRGVVDAAFSRKGIQMDWKKTELCTVNGFCDGESYQIDFNTNFHLAKKNARSDESCENHFATTDPSRAWECSESARVIRQHIASPLFVRKDIQDGNTIKSYTQMGFGSAGDLGKLFEFSLRKFRTLPAFSSTRKPGVFGPQCGKHVGLKDRDAFFNQKIEKNGNEYSFHDVLWSWVNNGPDFLVQDFLYNDTPSSCL